MSLLSLVRVSVGEVGVKPGTIKMLSTDDLATVTAAGYLNGIGNQLSSLDIAPSDVIECLYSYSAITDSGTYTVLSVAISNGVITLSAGAGSEPLPSAQIFVGNSGGVAQARAMTGDISITNTGVTAIVADAVTTAKILNSNVTLAKLASGITPSHVIKFAGQHTTTASVTNAIAVAGALSTDLAFVQMVDDGTNSVTVVQAVMTADTLTITFSGDPSTDAIVNYEIIRAAA